MTTPQFLTDDNTLNSIERHIIPDDARLDALPEFFGRRAFIFESKVYDWMEFLSADYRGGYWEFYRLSNNGFYMAPKTEKTFHMVNPGNYFDGELSADAAGISACCFTFSHLAFEHPDSVFAERFHQLRDFAVSHSESAKIFQLID